MESIYRQIGCSRRTPVSKSTIWVAGDHLLSVESNRMAEEYRRYYFRDIQALVLEKSASGRTTVTYPLIAILILVTAVALYAGRWLAVFPFLVLAGVAMFELLARNCRCLIVTRSSQEFLPAMANVRQSQSALAELQELILAAQGSEHPGKEPDDGGPDATAVL